MSELERISISIEKPLLDKLEDLVKRSKYENRSEYLRDMIRDRLVRETWEADEEALGTITLIYDHHKRNLSEKLTELQHEHHEAILACTHLHLTHEICGEMIMVRGRASMIQALCDRLGQQKGVLHASLSIGALRGLIDHRHSHSH